MNTGIVSRVLLVGILAGLVAGLVLTGIQRLAVVPMIFEAESYEIGGHSHGDEAAAGHGEATTGAQVEAWAPDDGLERTLFTALANVLAAVGFGLLLSAGFALRGGVNWWKGVLWGLAGFLTFNFAPALGLPPELPGAAAGELGARQFWWILTVICTGGGLALLAFASKLSFKALGAVLLLVPHVIGAPQPEAHGGLAPAELEQAFVLVSLVTNAVFWTVLGLVAGLLFEHWPGAARKGGRHEAMA